MDPAHKKIPILNWALETVGGGGLSNLDHSSDAPPVAYRLLSAVRSGDSNKEVSALVRSGDLYQLFPELRDHEHLKLESNWHGDESCLQSSLRAVAVCSAYLSARGDLSAWCSDLIRITGCFLHLGKRATSADAGDQRGIQVVLPPRSGETEARIRFPGHAPRSADIFRQRFTDLARLEGPSFPFEPSMISLAANWLRCSHQVHARTRSPIQESVSDAWTDRILRQLFRSVSRAPQSVASEALEGLMALVHTRHQICNPIACERTQELAPNALQALHTRWERQGERLDLLQKALRNRVDSVVQDLSRPLNIPSVGGTDWEWLGIPQTSRREAHGVSGKMTSRGSSRLQILKALHAKYNSQPISEDELTARAQTSPHIAPPYQRFYRVQERALVTYPEDLYTVKFFAHEPIRQFTPHAEETALSSYLSSHPSPCVEGFLTSLGAEPGSQPLTTLRELLTQGPFTSIPELEHYLHSHSTDPRLVRTRSFTLQKFAEITRQASHLGNHSPIIILHGFQSEHEHCGSGVEHILHQRERQIQKYAQRESMQYADAVESFLLDGIMFVAGTATSRVQSARQPIDHSILTGPSRDNRYFVSLILRQGRDYRGAAVDFLVTAIVHPSQIAASRYAIKNGRDAGGTESNER